MGKDSNSKKTKSKTIAKILLLVFFIGIFSIILVFIGIGSGMIGYMPDIEDLANPIDKYASQVYSSDGEVLGTYSQDKNNRIYSNYSDLSPYLVKALVATEDARFYSHSGVDMPALMRVFFKTVMMRQASGGGGSTITQQLAKQLWSPPAENVLERGLQKPIEWVIAVRLERYYTKEEIINLYLNKFDFLYNAVGIQSAAQVYFNKMPKELSIEEAATLIGMCKNPSYYNPVRKNERTRERRNVVLTQMFKSDYITQNELDSLKQLPLKLEFRRIDHKDGLAPYLREYLRITMSASKPNRSNYASWQGEQYSLDSLSWETNPLYGWCNKNKKPDGSFYNLATDGLKIYTTLDARMQRYAEEAVTQHMSETLQPQFDKEKQGRSYAPFSYAVRNGADSLLYRAMKITDRYRAMKNSGLSESQIYKVFKEPTEMKVFSWRGEIDTIMSPLDSIRYHKQFLRTGFMAMDTHNGYVKAYVGGIDYKYFQYDMVNMGRRQVGSTIKPYLYTLAMEEGMTPCDEMHHVEQVLKTESGKQWIPRNSNQKRVGEMVTIKWGLQNSDNWVTAYLMKRTSPYAFARLLHSFGITGYIDPVVSMSLGTHDVSVGEMTAAYTSFANKGIRANPLYVTHIEDSYGNIIASFAPNLDEVFSEGTYVKMLDMLRAVIDGGTGGRVRRYGVSVPMGGKTGTTQNNSDGWFMGFTPKLSTGCWVGGEERSIHFDRMAQGQGATMALPICAMFLKKVYDDPDLGYSSSEQFETISGFANPCYKGPIEESINTNNTNNSKPVGIDKMFQ